MPRIAIAFDIDNTLLNISAYEKKIQIEWNGGKELWLTLLRELTLLSQATGVKIHFGIVTAKLFMHETVTEIAKTFKDYLHSTEQTFPIKKGDKKYFPIFRDKNIWDYCHLGSHYQINGDTVKSSERVSSVHLTSGCDKSYALHAIKEMFDVERPEEVVFVDDLPGYQQGPRQEGFTVVCAGAINRGENTADQRERETKRVILEIYEKAKEQIGKLKLEALEKMLENAEDQDAIRDYLGTKVSKTKTLLYFIIIKHSNFVNKLLRRGIVTPEEIIQINPFFAYAHHRLAKKFLANRQYEEVIRCCTQSILIKQESRFYFLRASAYKALDKCDLYSRDKKIAKKLSQTEDMTTSSKRKINSQLFDSTNPMKKNPDKAQKISYRTQICHH